ncbi:MAG TPA: Rieske 2Fe-2S domain-containing protein [Streptosporangiaceae bacterium]|jgi:ubiquinol-cytochrome c reductase iron-sulfur subunit|nr:Rieske 2Fe-2S domain-containing protein [Streptosporangiaceae bacterium]
MSDMEETEGSEGPVAPRRVIGTPPPTPRLLGSTAVAEGGHGGQVGDETGRGEHIGDEITTYTVPEQRAKRVEKIVAGCFLFAFIAGCGFIAAYVGLETGSNRLGSGDSVVDAALRSNLALGTSLAVTLIALGLGALLWVRYLMPDVEVVEERHDLRSDPKDRQAFEQYFKEGASNSQFVKRPLVRRTLMLGTLPLLAAPVLLLRDLGPLPGTSLRHTVWSPGRRLLVFGTDTPITAAEFSVPGSAITIVPEGYVDDADALTKATVTLIKFRPGELDIPTRMAGSTLIGTMNWTVDNIVAYSRICTHVGCPVGLYEQTTHHLLCPCHQSTFDASKGAEVIFGPAPRPLPQLPITVDAQGYLVAKSDFTQPVGPSFWERG